MAILYALIFPGFRKVLGHVPGLTTIFAVSPEPSDIDFSCQGDALSRFVLLCRRPIPPFTVNKLPGFSVQYSLLEYG